MEDDVDAQYGINLVSNVDIERDDDNQEDKYEEEEDEKEMDADEEDEDEDDDDGKEPGTIGLGEILKHRLTMQIAW